MELDKDATIRALSALVADQKLKAQALESIDAWFKDGDYVIDGWTRNQVEPVFFRYALLFEHVNFPNTPLIETSFKLQDKSGNEIGYYTSYTTWNGEADDDYFVINKPNPEMICEDD